MQNHQSKNHRLIGERGAPAERVILAEYPADDGDSKRQVGSNGTYLPQPTPAPALYSLIQQLERNAHRHGAGSYGRTYLMDTAARHRKTLAVAGAFVPPAYDPTPARPALLPPAEGSEERAHLGFAALPAWEMDAA